MAMAKTIAAAALCSMRLGSLGSLWAGQLLIPIRASADPAVGTQDCDGYTQYTQLRHGQATHDFDDGGCYYCSKYSGSMYPMSGSMLSDHCESLCDKDPLCTSYSIARPPVLHADEYHYGYAANCCLEREDYPDGMFVSIDDQTTELNPCQMEIACWTRFELTEGPCDEPRTKTQIDDSQQLCSLIWKPRQYTDESIKKRVDFITQGCRYDDETFVLMLEDAHDQCRTEIEEESSTSSPSEGDASPHRYAWIAHGSIGVVTFGLLVPLAFFGTALSAYVRLGVHILAFALTFATVAMAIVALSGMGNSSEGHLKEDHHISGLLLLLLMSIQTASGLLLPSDGPSKENSYEVDYYEQRRVAVERLCHFVQKVLKVGIFCLGLYQVHSGLTLYAKKYSTIELGGAYVGLAGISALSAVAMKAWMKWRNKKTNDGYSVELQFRDINFD